MYMPYVVVKYATIGLNVLIILLLVIGNAKKNIDGKPPVEIKREVSAVWLMLVVLVMNTALLLVR